ncbi:MAG: helix-turn-helix transcriptional regulator [Pseudomonadales bacterium]|nr:helix-turn-helix transcriptional regulator [Pseudomonadales bacterium]
MPVMQVDNLASLFKALSEPVRVRIVYLLLQKGELCVCDIVDALALSQAVVSRHLAYLRRNNLVQARQDGVWVHYQLALEGGNDFTSLFGFLRDQAAAISECKQDLIRLEKVTSCCIS